MKRSVEDTVVAVILAARLQYLAAGANPLKHWDQIASGLLRASRTSATLAQWTTALCRKLQIVAPNKLLCSAIGELREVVVDDSGFLTAVEEEVPFLIQAARAKSEQIREEKKMQSELATAQKREDGYGTTPD